MYYAKKYGLQTGDQIVEPLYSLGLSKHFAVYLGRDANGIEWIAENHKTKGVQLIVAHHYFKGVKAISRIDKFQGSVQQRQALMHKAKKLIGTPYDVVSYNCEHFATELTSGVSESRQVRLVVLSILGLICFKVLNKS